MKKFVTLLVTLLVIASLSFCAVAEEKPFAGQTLTISTFSFNAELLQKNVYDPFEAATGAKLVVDTGRNPERVTKIVESPEDYDVVIIGDMFVDQLREAGVLETARGGLLRRGVAVRDADVALVTNVSADHFGEYGIHDLDALAEVKLLVAKTLASEGTLIANAGDAVLAARAAALQPTRRVAWFARELSDAEARGLPACGVRDGRLRIIDGERDIDLGAIDAMPLTLGGVVGYNIENIAAASLAAYLMGVSADVIRVGLARFGLDPSQNRGRLQRWQAHGVDVLLDYAHNPEGLQGLLQVAGALRGHGRLALLLGQAGNRSDEDSRALANVAATARPDRVWLKDIGGEYMRGREPGEVAGILRQALLDAGMREDALPVCLDEHQAARAALAWARPGDMLVLPVHEAEQRDSVISMIEDWQAHSNERGTGMPGNR